MNKKRLFYARMLAGLILLSVFIYTTGFKEIGAVLNQIQPIYALVIFFCLFALFLTGAINIWLLLGIFQKLRLIPFLRIYSYSFVAGLFMPGQVGDAAIILFLKKQQFKVAESALAYMVDKLITFILFFCISIYGVWRFFPFVFSFEVRPPAWFILLFAALAVFSIFGVKKFHLDARLSGFYKILRKWDILLVNLGLTIIKWFIVSNAFYFAFLAFKTEVDWPEVSIIPIMSTLVGYIPVSIAGIGTVEISAGYLFAKVGILNSVVLSAYLLMRFMQYTLAFMLMCLNLCWGSKPDISSQE